MSSPHYHVEDYPSDEEDFDSDFYKEIERIQEENKKKDLEERENILIALFPEELPTPPKKTRKNNKRTTSAERNKAAGKQVIKLIKTSGMRRRK